MDSKKSKRSVDEGSTFKERTYYGPTGTPEFPYRGPIDDGSILPQGLRRVLSVCGSTLVALLLILVLTACIVSTALVVYVMNFRDEVTNVTIEEMEMKYNTNVYAKDKNGEWVNLYEVNNQTSRVPVTIDQVPQYVRDAFVCAEDERFYQHDGVDYKRTVSAFANMFIHLYDTNQGGSTITQQLIKNITGDSEQSPSRKIREIFRAMELERAYSKDKILETYLNYIGFGGPTSGIEAAARKYFGKSVSELDLAEASSLACIPKSPEVLNPFAGYKDDQTGEWVATGRARNESRRRYILRTMYRQGAISYDDYQAAVNEKLIFTDSDEYKALHADEEEQETTQMTSWVVDAAIYEVADYLSDTFNLSTTEAIARINHGGYQIYTTIDLDMQNYVETQYRDIGNIIEKDRVVKYSDLDGDGQITQSETIYPQSAFVAMNYSGEILSIVGAAGEKPSPLCWNYATMEPRQPGSTIKPLTTYGLALESDMIHWGSVYKDDPIELNGQQWPTNYSEDSSAMSYSHSNVKIYEALERSLNTIPAQLCEALTPDKVFEFATQKMRVALDEDNGEGRSDRSYSALTVGALTYGLTLENLVNGYVPYGNGGTQYDAHLVSKVMRGSDEIIYENNGNPARAVSEETAYVMNQFLQDIVANGTGTAAQLPHKHVGGKTGTTENWNDLTFVGLTDDFVSGVWLGYAQRSELEDHTIESAQVWKNVIGAYADSINTGSTYPTSPTVIEDQVCKLTGQRAGKYCATDGIGYWKPSNAPVCDSCRSSTKRNTSSSTRRRITTTALWDEDSTTYTQVVNDDGEVQNIVITPVEDSSAANRNTWDDDSSASALYNYDSSTADSSADGSSYSSGDGSSYSESSSDDEDDGE